MLIRFTEFVKHLDRDVGLYIIQENNEFQALCFTVYVHDSEKFEIDMCKQKDNEWEILTHNLPYWVKELTPVITSTIEKNMINLNQALLRFK